MKGLELIEIGLDYGKVIGHDVCKAGRQSSGWLEYGIEREAKTCVRELNYRRMDQWHMRIRASIRVVVEAASPSSAGGTPCQEPVAGVTHVATSAQLGSSESTCYVGHSNGDRARFIDCSLCRGDSSYARGIDTS